MACKRSWLGQRVGGDLGARSGWSPSPRSRRPIVNPIDPEVLQAA
jgi:hypothetical protein